MYSYIKIFDVCIPSYGLCVCMAVFLCSILVLKKSQKLNLDFNDLMALIAIIIGCGMLGSGLLYILVTYNFETIYKQLLAGDFSFIKNSGTVFYGGLIFGVFGGIIASSLLKIKLNIAEACIVPYIPLGHAIGRVGCLLGGCCYGMPYKGIFAISARFGSEGITYFPIQVVEILFNLLIMTALLFYTRNKRGKYSVMILYLIMYSCLRFYLEFFRGDEIRGRFLAFSTSQWLSLIVFILCLILFVRRQEKGGDNSYEM